MLEIRGVSKSFGGVKAVDGVSFMVEANEIHGLIGPNGAKQDHHDQPDFGFADTECR